MGLPSVFLSIQTMHFLWCSVCYLCLRGTWKTEFAVFAGQSNFLCYFGVNFCRAHKLDYQSLFRKGARVFFSEGCAGTGPERTVDRTYPAWRQGYKSKPFVHVNFELMMKTRLSFYFLCYSHSFTFH